MTLGGVSNIFRNGKSLVEIVTAPMLQSKGIFSRIANLVLKLGTVESFFHFYLLLIVTGYIFAVDINNRQLWKQPEK